MNRGLLGQYTGTPYSLLIVLNFIPTVESVGFLLVTCLSVRVQLENMEPNLPAPICLLSLDTKEQKWLHTNVYHI